MERLLKKGYEVIYLTEPVDEYCIQALPEFDGKRFQNVAKEGVKFDESDKAKEKREALEKEYEPLTTWLKDKALKEKVEHGLFCNNQIMTNTSHRGVEVLLQLCLFHQSHYFLQCCFFPHRLRRLSSLRG